MVVTLLFDLLLRLRFCARCQQFDWLNWHDFLCRICALTFFSLNHCDIVDKNFFTPGYVCSSNVFATNRVGSNWAERVSAYRFSLYRFLMNHVRWYLWCWWLGILRYSDSSSFWSWGFVQDASSVIVSIDMIFCAASVHWFSSTLVLSLSQMYLILLEKLQLQQRASSYWFRLYRAAMNHVWWYLWFCIVMIPSPSCGIDPGFCVVQCRFLTLPETKKLWLHVLSYRKWTRVEGVELPRSLGSQTT